jgi:hypothetical protein
MKFNTLCVVVIPVHDDCPSFNELISFKQCFEILKNHAIKVMVPKGLNLDSYLKVVPNFEVVEIDPIWQSSIFMYNKLKLSSFFYNLFKEFDYLLTYELDAFVFKDEIEYWCQKNYDYIGAPWFSGFSESKTNEIIGVGNSGFSLRKVSPMRKVIRNIYFDENSCSLESKKLQIKNIIKKGLFYVDVFRKENKTIQNSEHYNEDWFIANVITKYLKKYTIAPIEEAIQFSFEVNPIYLYHLNNSKLPMGCHAWGKYDFEFWKPQIANFGYQV